MTTDRPHYDLATLLVGVVLFPVALKLLFLAWGWGDTMLGGLLRWTLRSSPSDEHRWRRISVPIAMMSVVAWTGGLVFLSLLREWQLGSAALETDRQRFCAGMDYLFAVPYEVLRSVVAALLPVALTRHVLWVIPLMPAVALFAYCLWHLLGLRWLLCGPVLVTSSMLQEPPSVNRCGAVAGAIALPLLLILLGFIGWVPLPQGALYYLVCVTTMSFLTIGVFADDKVLALEHSRKEQAQKAADEQRRRAEAARALAGNQFDDDDDWRDRFSRARPRRRRLRPTRIPEVWLLAPVLLGGWPGALTAQRLLTHKIGEGKPWFVAHLYALIAIHNTVALVALYAWA